VEDSESIGVNFLTANLSGPVEMLRGSISKVKPTTTKYGDSSLRSE